MSVQNLMAMLRYFSIEQMEYNDITAPIATRKIYIWHFDDMVENTIYNAGLLISPLISQSLAIFIVLFCTEDKVQSKPLRLT